MRKFTVILSAIMLCMATAKAQNNFEQVIATIEQNNTTLVALRKQAEAQKVANKTGNTLPNPEVEYHHLWGDPSGLGRRNDISIQQSFDFPSAYLYRNQIAELKNQQAETEYRKQRLEIMLEARQQCIELVYLNASVLEFQKREQRAHALEKAYNSMFQKGECNIIDLNKARLNLLHHSQMLETVTIERDLTQERVTQLNGGNPISLTDSTFQTQLLPENFKLWYLVESAKNPDLQWIEQSITLSQKEQQLTKALLLPKFSTGYMSEKIGNEKHHGITLGISIPLWEGKNTVKAEKAKAEALEQFKTDANLKFLSHLKSVYNKTVQLQKNAHYLRQTLNQIDHSTLLTKAFEAGELSLIEYLNELTIYHDAIDKLLVTERDAAMAHAQLFQLSR